MDDFADWPAEVVARVVAQLHGTPEAIERLGGMSLGRVYRVRFASTTLIVKFCPWPTEPAFYNHMANDLRTVGVAVPALRGLVTLDAGDWLLLEDIPDPVPALNLGPPDNRMFVTLARLHAATWDSQPDIPKPPVYPWTDEVTKAALGCFPAATAVVLAPMLKRVQEESVHLEGAWCWISGDPNPLNWGERPDGTLVLYDWERFRQGQPATDLAIAMAGLGDTEKYTAVAQRYLLAWPLGKTVPPWTAEELARDIARAKVASVIEFLHLYATATVRPTGGLIPWLVSAVPPWVRSLVR